MRHPVRTAAAVAILFILAGLEAQAAGPFKIAFPFKAAGKNLPAGEYSLVVKEDGSSVLRRESTGAETVLSFTERIPRTEAADVEARLVFHMVGDFKPSYSEYITVYILAEAWPAGGDGYRLHTTKGAHKEITVRETAPEK